MLLLKAVDKWFIINGMGEVAIDALLDSLKILGVVFVFHVLLSFFEGKIAKLLERNTRFAPAFGSLFGIIPQCGVSVVAADLYSKKHVTMGTLVATFLACSDEALPIIFGNISSSWNKTLPMAFLLIGLKIVIGTFVGILVDLFFAKRKKEVVSHFDECEGEEGTHVGCCRHKIEDEKESPWHEHLLHPIIHSLKIFAFVFVISFAFGTLVYYIGEDNIANFLSSSRWLSPLFATLIGLIPNCVSSVLIAKLYVSGAIPFAALLSGLLVNAGLGVMVLLKKKDSLKDAFIILGICIATSLSVGYIALAIESAI